MIIKINYNNYSFYYYYYYYAVHAHRYVPVIKESTFADKREPYITTAMETFRGVPREEENTLSHSSYLQQLRVTSIPFGMFSQLHIMISILIGYIHF